MSIGSKIAQLRKEKGITQEALAKELDVTNQAVSKWESDQCCPDIQLLPKMADIFGVSVDALFGRENGATPKIEGLPWADDRKLHIVLYMGHTLLKHCKEAERLTFQYEGPALDVISAINVECQGVSGNVDAGGSVNCADVAGNIDAGGSVNCGNVEGSVDAGGMVKCSNVGGSVDAGSHVCCGNVGCDVDAGSNVECEKVFGSIDAGGKVVIQKA